MPLDIIGGEYCIEANALNKDIKSSIKPQFSLGRTCLYSILSALKSHLGGVLIPDYICYSVAEVPIRLRIPFKHYHVSYFLPNIESIKTLYLENKHKGKIAILLVSYFGLVDLNQIIPEIRKDLSDVIIIVDDVQNYYGFAQYNDFDYCFTSYRKWFPVPDGADVLYKNNYEKLELYSRCADYVDFKVSGALLKNHRNYIGDSISLKLLNKGEEMMDDSYLFGCSELSQKLLNRIDFDLIANKRRKNAEYLHNGLEKMNIHHLYNPDRVPLFIPIVIDNRDKVRSFLFSKNIFVPVHWPLKDKNTQGNNELYSKELSLVCDQRYDEKDMEKILRAIEYSL